MVNLAAPGARTPAAGASCARFRERLRRFREPAAPEFVNACGARSAFTRSGEARSPFPRPRRVHEIGEAALGRSPSPLPAAKPASTPPRPQAGSPTRAKPVHDPWGPHGCTCFRPSSFCNQAAWLQPPAQKNTPGEFPHREQQSETSISRVLFAGCVSARSVAVIPLGRALPRASCGLPRGSGGQPSNASLRGLAPDGVCRARAVTDSAVGSYSTVSPLPDTACAGRAVHFSVALSSRFPSPGVTRHPALRSPDFPLGPKPERAPAALERADPNPRDRSAQRSPDGTVRLRGQGVRGRGSVGGGREGRGRAAPRAAVNDPARARP